MTSFNVDRMQHAIGLTVSKMKSFSLLIKLWKEKKLTSAAGFACHRAV